MFWGIFIFRLHLTRGPESVTCDNEQNAWPILFCKLTQDPALATAITGEKKLGRGLEKNAGEWTGRVEISKEEIPGSKRSMHGYILTYSRL